MLCHDQSCQRQPNSTKSSRNIRHPCSIPAHLNLSGLERLLASGLQAEEQERQRVRDAWLDKQAESPPTVIPQLPGVPSPGRQVSMQH